MRRRDGDFGLLLKSAADGKLDTRAASLSERACVGIVLASADYPRSGTPLADLPGEIALPDDVHLFWGASSAQNGSVKSAGGRVLTVSALGDGLDSARARAYDAVRDLTQRFGSATGLTFRTDIGVIAE